MPGYNMEINMTSMINMIMTAIFSPVQDHLNYYVNVILNSNYLQNAFWQSGNDSRWIFGKQIVITVVCGNFASKTLVTEFL